MPEMKVQLTLSLAPFSEGLKTALNMGKSFHGQFKEIVSGMRVDVDEKAFDQELDKLEKHYKDFAAKATGESKKVEQSIKKIPKNKTTKIRVDADKVLTTLAKLGLAYNTVKGIVMKLVNGIKSLTDAHNLEQQVRQRLITITRATVQATEKQINSIVKLSDKLQNLSVIGNEVSIAGASQIASFNMQTESVEKLLPSLNTLGVATYGAKVNSDQMIQSANLLGKAFQGQTGALSRVGISFNDYQAHMLKTGNESERVNVLIEVINQNFGNLAVSMKNTASGIMQTFHNLVSDLKENAGELINVALIPIVRVLSSIIKALNDNKSVFGLLATSITALGIALVALKIKALAAAGAFAFLQGVINPLSVIVTGVIAGLTALGFSYASVKLSTDEATESQGKYNEQLKEAKGLLEQQKTVSEEIAEKRKRLAEIEDKQTKNRLEAHEIQLQIMNSQNDMQSVSAERRQRINQNEFNKLKKEKADILAFIDENTRVQLDLEKQFNEAKSKMDKEASLDGLDLLKYKLSEERKHYDELGELSDDNIEDKKKSYQNILNLENQIADKEDQLRKAKETKDKAALEKEKQRLEQEKEILLQHAKTRESINYDMDQTLLKQNYKFKEAELNSINRFYDQKEQMLKDAGQTDVDLSEQRNNAVKAINDKYSSGLMSTYGMMFNNLSKIAKAGGKKFFKIFKAFSIAQATMEGVQAAISAWKTGMKWGGIPLAAAMMATSVGVTGIQIATIAKQKFGDGGHVEGASHYDGGVDIEAEGGEFIFSVERVKMIGLKLLEWLNFGSSGSVQEFLSLIKNGGFIESLFEQINSYLSDFSNQLINDLTQMNFAFPDANLGQYLPELPQPETKSNESSSIIAVLRDIETAIIERVPIFNIFVKNRSKVEVHKENLEAQKAYSRRFA